MANTNKITQNENWIICYANGSKYAVSNSGLGIYITLLNKEISVGKYESFFQAELLAIMRAEIGIAGEGRQIVIISNSQAALKAKNSSRTNSKTNKTV